MKKLLLGALLISSILSPKIEAQSWAPVLTVPTPGIGLLKNVYFSDDQHGWAAGMKDDTYNIGMMYATTDGGTTWTEQAPNFFSPLYDVFFFDNNTGWAVGEFGSVYKTTNGGATWASLATISNSPELQKVRFTSLTNGYIVGTYNVYAYTTDGGATWTNVFISNDKYDLLFTTSQIGIACGTSQISRTTNGGTSWTQTTLGSGTTWRGIDTASINNLWVVGDAGYVTSTDQGATWSSIGSFSSGNGNDIKFLNANIGWVAQTGGIKKTINGGSTWTNDFTGDIYFTGIHAISETNVFMTAHNYTNTEAYIYRYSCAGATAPVLNSLGGFVSNPCEGSSFAYNAFDPSYDYTWTVPSDWTITSGATTSTPSGTVGATSGPITFTAVNSCGLTSNTLTYNVTVGTSTLPNPTFINQVSSNNCIGANNSFQTTAAPFGTEWVWSSNNWSFTGGNPITVNPYGTFVTDVPTATVSVYLQNACGGLSSTFTETFNLTLDTPLPEPIVTQNGNSFSTTAVADMYCWYNQSGAKSNGDTCIVGSDGMNYTPTISGEYVLVISTANGCETEATTTVSSSVSVEETENTNFSIFPNPTAGNITVSNLKIGATVKLLDVTGKVVFMQEVSNTTMNVSVLDLNSGIYFVQNIDNGKVLDTQKLIVSK